MDETNQITMEGTQESNEIMDKQSAGKIKREKKWKAEVKD